MVEDLQHLEKQNFAVAHGKRVYERNVLEADGALILQLPVPLEQLFLEVVSRAGLTRMMGVRACLTSGSCITRGRD